MKQLICVAFATLFLSCGERVIDERKNLLFTPEIGNSYDFDIIHTLQEAPKPGSPGDSTNMKFSLTPVSGDTTSTVFLMEISAISFVRDHTLPTPKFFFDKRDMSGEMIKMYNRWDSILDAVRDDSLYVTVDRFSKLKKLEGLPGLVTKIAALTQIPESDVSRVLKQHLSSESLYDLFASIFYYLPAGPLAKGSSWVNNTVITSMAPVKRSNMITIDTFQNDKVFLDTETQISAGEPEDYYMTGSGKSKAIIGIHHALPESMEKEENVTIKTTGDTRVQKRTLKLKMTAHRS